MNKLTKNKQNIIHPFEPIYDQNSKILILGSFPSVKSREIGFYYGHPKNRFWTVLSIVFEEPYPDTIERKKNMILKHHLALWDVIKTCKIEGSSDSTISNVVVNDIKGLIKKTKIEKIITIGKKADSLYQKYCYPETFIASLCLYSTSPANCAISLEKLVNQYKILKNEKKR